ncbi:hypothetical protein [Lepagella muris]|uniref:Uncharacterized protein n=1 Tax=Lepagella muris TaxID=3032870 RepID=A0AC61RJH8_9BACT|nr:hypothetical protein [Lepagella muris]TGY80006.1 hypothetical protein E5331_04245 [Lepagella muris]THG53244.1 hypothetical protein E5984_04015 [Bacteroidales bacterium]TKC64871.1 hypothetical protein E5359_001790 [Bacteroidales bacterium]
MTQDIKGQVIRTKRPNKPIRLPRKFKKDIIKTSGRESYWKIIGLMYMQVMMGGTQYLKIRKVNE